MTFWILPKNEHWGIFQHIKLPQRSFFGRIEDIIYFFRDLLTFSAYVIYEWYFRPPSQGCTRDDLPSISLKWILSVLSFLQFRKYAKTTSLSLICRFLIQSVISKLSISSCWASKNSKISLLFNFFPFWCWPNLNDCKESTVRKFSCFSHM